MIVETYDALGNPHKFEATRVLVRDEKTGPIALVMETGPHNFFALHRGDGDAAMNRALATMGVNETVVSDMVDTKEFPKPPGQLWTPG